MLVGISQKGNDLAFLSRVERPSEHFATCRLDFPDKRREQLWGKEALDNPDLLMPPASVAASYWQLYQQPRSAWTFELEIRPFGEKW